ncbi:MAG: hypothetical protein FWD16_05250 [Clostridia bacterium]|nr:hypothetical protein [Clostridia bacterium]
MKLKTKAIMATALLMSLLTMAGCGFSINVTLPPDSETATPAQTEAAVSQPPALSPETSSIAQTTPEPSSDELYVFQITATVNDVRQLKGGGVCEFKFSRAKFQGTSAAVALANKAFDDAEARFKNRMKDAIADYCDDETDAQYYFTQECKAVHEKGGTVSFIISERWFMGGVSNSSIEGHTFDFKTLERELKIGDIMIGLKADVQKALENELYEWYRAVNGTAMADADFAENREYIAQQSGPDANFYLDPDGVHVFFMPYILPATQDGVDLLFPWTMSELVGRGEWSPIY